MSCACLSTRIFLQHPDNALSAALSTLRGVTAVLALAFGSALGLYGYILSRQLPPSKKPSVSTADQVKVVLAMLLFIVLGIVTLVVLLIDRLR